MCVCVCVCGSGCIQESRCAYMYVCARTCVRACKRARVRMAGCTVLFYSSNMYSVRTYIRTSKSHILLNTSGTVTVTPPLLSGTE